MTEPEPEHGIDRPSYELGVIAAFSEMVAMGVKKLALSSPLTPELYEAIRERAQKISTDYGINTHTETDLLVTDLFSEDVAENMYVIFLYRDDDILENYEALKARKRGLLDSGSYSGEPRKQLARDFARLLSYPEETIAARGL